ncbi:MAG: gamma-glutamyl-gamma-aminobutyrate hydrolase family protein [Gammaproteobacteria bacterium]|nr:gamma-glutamyl-gamma-aminobutyrate hydrolase family protein [Gammaproteobacteria bacterium]
MSKSRISNPLLAVVSYNHEIGGATADSLIQVIMQKLDMTVALADYRKITPPQDNLDSIFINNDLVFKVVANSKRRAWAYLKDADCLILPGNHAIIDPRLFGGNLSADQQIDLARAIAEMALIHVAMQRGIPILAVCGGHQIINIYLGGKVADLSEDDIDQQGFMAYASILFDKNSEIAKICYKNSKTVRGNFFGAHQEAVTEYGGKGLINNKDDSMAVVAVANDANFNIEGMEAKYGAPIYSFQFHPEVSVVGMYSKLYRAVSYHPETQHDIEISLRLFIAFKQAAQTFQTKKLIKFDQFKNDIRNKTKDPQNEQAYHFTSGTNVKPTLRSIFTEVRTDETQKDDSAVIEVRYKP